MIQAPESLPEHFDRTGACMDRNRLAAATIAPPPVKLCDASRGVGVRVREQDRIDRADDPRLLREVTGHVDQHGRPILDEQGALEAARPPLARGAAAGSRTEKMKRQAHR
jgi:hypothetical protein